MGGSTGGISGEMGCGDGEGAKSGEMKGAGLGLPKPGLGLPKPGLLPGLLPGLGLKPGLKPGLLPMIGLPPGMGLLMGLGLRRQAGGKGTAA